MIFDLPKMLDHILGNWLRYLTLVITGVLTWNAAWELTGNPLYCVFLVGLAEGATLFWQHAFERVGGVAKEGWKFNVPVIVQFLSAGAGILFAWIAIIATDVASLTFIAKSSQIEIFSAFQDVPVWAQSVVVYVIPVLAVSHGILTVIYNVASPEASASRRIRRAHTSAKVAEAEAHAYEYERLATDRAKEAGRAKAGNRVLSDFRPAEPVYKSNGNHGEPEKVFTNPPKRLKD